MERLWKWRLSPFFPNSLQFFPDSLHFFPDSLHFFPDFSTVFQTFSTVDSTESVQKKGAQPQMQNVLIFLVQIYLHKKKHQLHIETPLRAIIISSCPSIIRSFPLGYLTLLLPPNHVSFSIAF